MTFSDVLGDKQFNLYAQSISQYRTLSFSFINLSRRFNYAVQAYSQTLFFYGQLANVFYDPVYSRLHRSQPRAGDEHDPGRIGLRHLPVEPVSPRRAERWGPAVQAVVQRSEPAGHLDDLSGAAFGRQLFQNGTFMPLTATFVEETTIFREFGPLSGRTMRLSYETSPAIGGLLSRQTLDADVRKYTRLGTTGLLALRLRGFQQLGRGAGLHLLRRQLRAARLRVSAVPRITNTAFANAELRFPLIEAMLTPLGVLGGIRGVFFAGMGGAHFDGQPFTWWRTRND